MPNPPDPPVFGLITCPQSPIHNGVDPPPRPPWSHRIDFPRFTEGDDPLAWIFKAEQYFSFYNTPANHRVLTASFHMDGEVLQWFRLLDCVQTTPS